MGRLLKQPMVPVQKSVKLGNGSDTAFTFGSFSPAFVLPGNYTTESDIMVFVGGIHQEPGTDYEINAGTSTITFGVAPGNSLRIVAISGLNSTQNS